MRIDVDKACGLLESWDNIVILSHQKPDGDTLGSAFALLHALECLGKTARVECSDGFPSRYSFLYQGYVPKVFAPNKVVTVDVAAPGLLGRLEETYGNRVDLCIDHHISNSMPAKYVLLDTDAPAAAQIVLEVIRGLGAPVDKTVGDALFTGLATDTGCFKYDNVTAATHRAAADLIDAGADHGTINKRMFDTMSKGRMQVDTLVMESLEYHFGDTCALIYIPAELPARFGVTEEELDGISSKPRRIEGVLAGITIRERDGGDYYRISLRSGGGVDSCRICAEFGGGGHKNAAGCTMEGSLDQVKERLLEAVRRELEEIGAI